MPPNLFLHWNSVSEVDRSNSASSSLKFIHSRTQNGKVVRGAPATVVASEYPPNEYAWPYILKPSEQRTAKCVARMKLQEKLDSMNKCTEVKSQARKQTSKGRRNSPKPRQSKCLPASDGTIQWFDGIKCSAEQRTRSLPPLVNKIALKRLSIRMRRIPVRIRKKRASDADELRSRSSSCSTTDSSLDLSLSSPLDNLCRQSLQNSLM